MFIDVNYMYIWKEIYKFKLLKNSLLLNILNVKYNVFIVLLYFCEFSFMG